MGSVFKTRGCFPLTLLSNTARGEWLYALDEGLGGQKSAKLSPLVSIRSRTGSPQDMSINDPHALVDWTIEITRQ